MGCEQLMQVCPIPLQQSPSPRAKPIQPFEFSKDVKYGAKARSLLDLSLHPCSRLALTKIGLGMSGRRRAPSKRALEAQTAAAEEEPRATRSKQTSKKATALAAPELEAGISRGHAAIRGLQDDDMDMSQEEQGEAEPDLTLCESPPPVRPAFVAMVGLPGPMR